jgi:hypothetical protein
MSASMLIPTFGAIALLQASVVDDIGVLLVAEHLAMLLGMLGAMLLRPAEYTGHHAEARVELQMAA